MQVDGSTSATGAGRGASLGARPQGDDAKVFHAIVLGFEEAAPELATSTAAKDGLSGTGLPGTGLAKTSLAGQKSAGFSAPAPATHKAEHLEKQNLSGPAGPDNAPLPAVTAPAEDLPDSATVKTRRQSSDPIAASSSQGESVGPQAAQEPAVAQPAKSAWTEQLAQASKQEASVSDAASGRIEVQFHDPQWVLSGMEVQALADGALQIRLKADPASAPIAATELDRLKRRLQGKGLDVADVQIVDDGGDAERGP